MTQQTDARSVEVNAGELVVTWTDDRVTRIDLVELRRACACAECNELREQDRELWPKPGDPDHLEVLAAELIGAWGLSLRFNDGHELGIYPWKSLRAWPS